jgi:2-dehydropantoate 2-reductase
VNALVLGSGPVGSFLAWALAAGGADVSIVRRSASSSNEQIDLAVVRRGAPLPTARVVQLRTTPDAAAEPDIVVVAVKAFDVEDAIATVPQWPRAAILTVQNGIGSEEVAQAARPGNQLIAGSLTASLDRLPDGRIRWRRRGGIGLAAVPARRDGATDGGLLAALVGVFRAGGLPARSLPDWRAMKWSKLVANLVANATSALVDEPPSVIYTDPGLYEVERSQLREAFAVLRGLGLRPVALPGASVPQLELALTLPSALGRPILARIVGGARGGKDPSLRIGMTDGDDQSEIGWLNGAVARTGTALDIPAPVNRVLVDLVQAARSDPEVRARFRNRPDELVAEVRARTAASPAGPRARGTPR